MSAASTRCPKCNMTFRVTDAQLQVAKGKVRCGSCLHVFKAADHWVGGEAEAKPAAKAAESKAADAKAAGKFQFDQSAIDSGSADKVLTKPVPVVAPKPKPAPPPAKAPPKKPVEEDDDDIRFSDEDEGLISDGRDTSAQRATPAIQAGDDYSDIFLNLDDLGDDDGGMVLDESAGGKSVEAADESWAKEILTDLTDDSAEKAAQIKAVLAADERANVFVDDGHVKKREGARDGFISGNREDADQALRDLGMDQPPAKRGMNRRDMLHTIEPAPVDMQGQGRSAADWKALALWGSLTGLCTLLLLIQFAWIQFDRLARENAFRPLYATACAILSCQLPDQFNPDAISTSNLVVRPAKDLAYALQVDALIENRASYAQPFPDLELSFTDINNFPVASRRFKPREYLAGELAGKKEMPPAKPVHISLQIVDPGPKAVSYGLQIPDNKGF